MGQQPRFDATYCSQCGANLGPGDHGVSSCCDHGKCRVIARGDACECDRKQATIPQDASPAVRKAIERFNKIMLERWLARFDSRAVKCCAGNRGPTIAQKCVTCPYLEDSQPATENEEISKPCEVCGSNERGHAGYLLCECPASSIHSGSGEAGNADVQPTRPPQCNRGADSSCCGLGCHADNAEFPAPLTAKERGALGGGHIPCAVALGVKGLER